MAVVYGFTVLKNGVKLGYPFLESILSVIDQVDRFAIQEGFSEDDTLQWLQKLALKYRSKIYITRYRWKRMTTGFAIGDATNALMDLLRPTAATHLWLVQSDELYHPSMAADMRVSAERDTDVDGWEVPFLHLEHNYQIVQEGAGYQHAIRMVRNLPYIKSHRDAWTFEGVRHVARFSDGHPVVHINKGYWDNIPLKVRSHADLLYPDLGHYNASAEKYERWHESEPPPEFTATTSPFEDKLPDVVKPTIGMLRYQPREELVK